MRREKHPLGAAMLSAWAVWLLAAGPAGALVLQPEQEGPPPTRPPDAVVGRWGANGSCVAIGSTYVLTTRHQGYGVGTTVTIDGTAYVVAELFNHASADLRVARITNLAGEPAGLSSYVAPYTNTDERYKTVVIGGYGQGRGAALQTGGVTYGYAWAGAANTTLRWGANRVDSTNQAVGTYTSDVLVADFDAYDAPAGQFRVAYEAATALWDSGGGWFINVAGAWQVAGLTRSTEHEGESWFRSKTNPAVLDPDLFDAVRVSSYAGWINGVLYPTDWAVDGDGLWTSAANWSAGVPDAADKWAVLGGTATGPRTITLGSNVTIGTLRLDDNDPYTVAATGSNRLAFGVTSGSALILVPSTGSGAAHVVSAPLLLNVPLIVNQGTSPLLTLSGAISGTGSLTKEGGGPVLLSGPNAYSGGTVVRAGTLRVASPTGLGTGAVTLSGGTLDLRADAPTTYNNNVTINGPVTISVNPAAAGSGAVLTLKSLSIDGERTLTVTGTSGYGLAFSGPAVFNPTGAGVTLNTASADLRLAGGLTYTFATLAKTGPAGLIVDGPINFFAGTVLAVGAGTATLNAETGGTLAAHNLTVNVTGASAAVEFGATQHLAALNVSAGSARVTAPGTAVVVTKGLLVNSAAGARLDLGLNDLVLDYTGASPLAQVAGWVRAGYNRAGGGYWNGVGIASSAAAADTQRLAAVGLADNAVLGRTTFAGQAIDATSLLVKVTWWGDADLDGAVTFDDYDVIDYAYWFPPAPGEAGWWNGDFDYDGDVDFDDYDLIDYAYWFQGGVLGGGGAAPAAGLPDALLLEPDPPSLGGGTLLPEPATLALVGAGLALAAARRRGPCRPAPR